MTEYKIDKGIPAPEFRTKYPFSQMEIGDSFLIDTNKSGGIYGACHHFIKRHAPEKKFMVRKVEGGVRVWRIK